MGLILRKTDVNLNTTLPSSRCTTTIYEKPFTFANLTIGCPTMKDLYVNLKPKMNINLNWSVYYHEVSISLKMNQN